MENRLENIHIQNFKSIKDVSVQCEQINIFIGQPNVGKSNFLEALSLLGPNFLNNGWGFGRPMLRYEIAANLFFDQAFLEDEIIVQADHKAVARLRSEQGGFFYEMQYQGKGEVSASFSLDGSIRGFNVNFDKVFFPVKFYKFSDNQPFAAGSNALYLLPPYGANFLNVIQSNRAVRKEASELFEPYGLELLVDNLANRLEIVKKQDGILFKTPYSLVADTLRRYLFHFAALASNRNSILLFEEPESHHFPPFIQRLAQRILEDESNQYFITTHSPFLLNTILEKNTSVAVFLVEFENFQTRIHRLSDESLRDVLDHGINIFSALEQFEQ
jgi:AAA15 family ATPase/GTPase